MYAIQIMRALHADGGQTRCKILIFCTYGILQLVVTVLFRKVWEHSATNAHTNKSVYFQGGCVIKMFILLVTAFSSYCAFYAVIRRFTLRILEHGEDFQYRIQ